jgi:myo-inositol-1(or 4)-monophosphatase
VDIASERLIAGRLRAAFPTHTIVGEERGASVGGDPSHKWFIDPVDGTTNYAHGFPFFCVSIGLEIEGEPALGVVCSPTFGELFVAEAGGGATLNGRSIEVSSTTDLGQALLATGFPYDRGAFAPALRSFERLSLRSQAVRRAGSAALDMCYVACGRLDGYWEHQVMPWDMAAGRLLVVEAGGRVTTTADGAFAVDSGNVVASNGALHAQLIDALATPE